jgi:hypothetical protein
LTDPPAAREAVRVLLVDDNREFAENLADLARLQGLEPSVAHDFGSALALARARPFDVAVVDQKLPDGQGTDLLAELRAASPDIVSLVVTAFVSLDNSLAALNEGAFAFVGKDADAEDLVATLARAAENARLRRENRSLRGLQSSILEALPVFLMLLDEERRVYSVNRRNEVLCPLEPAQAVGRPVEEVIAPFARARLDVRNWLDEVERTPIAEGSRETRLLEVRDARDRLTILEINAIPLAGAPKRLTLLRAVDLTERILLERRVTESEHLAALGRLVSSIAHEIRNPLAGIRALAQLLQRRLRDDPRARENADEILALTDRMHATLSDLLDFARPGAQRDETIELYTLLEGLVAEARRSPAAEGREVTLQRSDGRPLELVAARDRVASIFANLIDNALHAAPPGGRVRLTWRATDEGIEVDVEDDGPGIPDAVRPRLFQPFFTTKTRGTGLGLSIVRKNAESLGGSVEAARSQDLGGARFTVRLPAAPRR